MLVSLVTSLFSSLTSITSSSPLSRAIHLFSPDGRTTRQSMIPESCSKSATTSESARNFIVKTFNDRGGEDDPGSSSYSSSVSPASPPPSTIHSIKCDAPPWGQPGSQPLSIQSRAEEPLHLKNTEPVLFMCCSSWVLMLLLLLRLLIFLLDISLLIHLS